MGDGVLEGETRMISAAFHTDNGAIESHLLACLPGSVRALWEPHLEPVDLELGQAIYEVQGRLPYVYFPLTAIVSLLYVLENGAWAEIAIVGNEGMVGFALIMGGDTTPSRAVVQSAGKALRMKASFMKHEFQLVPPVLHLMLRYTSTSSIKYCTRRYSQSCPWSR